MKSIKVSKDKYLDYYNSYVQEKFKKLKYKSGFNAFISQYDDKKERLNIIANGVHNAAGQNFYIILKSLFTNTSNNLVDTGTTDTIEFIYSGTYFYFYDSTAAADEVLVPNVSITDNNGVKYTTSNITSAIANPTNLTLSILIPANTFTGSSISSITLYSNAGAVTITYSNITPPTNTINPALATTINLVFSDML